MTPKYFGDRDPRWHGSDCELHYPGTADGFPIRTPRGAAAPPVKDHEYGRIPIVADFRIAVFNTWEPESLAKYQELLDRIVNGQFQLCRRTEPAFVAEKQGWTWFVEWVQPYGSMGEAPSRRPYR